MSVKNLDISSGSTLPNIVLKTVITARAPKDPKKTISFGYFMAQIIARKKVLSPI